MIDGVKPAAKKARRKAGARSGAAQPRQSAELRKPRQPAAPRKPRHYLPAEERRKRILEAAKEVFARTGLQGSRTRDLAQAAGINQATLFEHFKSKEELFAAAVLRPLTELLDGVRERYAAYEAADSPENLLGLLQTGMQKHLENMVEIYPLLIQALFSDQESGRKLYHEQILPLMRARTELMRNVIKDTMDPNLVELASFGMFFAIAMDRVMTGKTGDLAAVSRQLTDLIIFGCAPHHQWDSLKRSTTKPRKTTEKNKA